MEALETAQLAIQFLGWSLIVLIFGVVLCFLASLGYNTYMKLQNKHKKLKFTPRTPI